MGDLKSDSRPSQGLFYALGELGIVWGPTASFFFPPSTYSDLIFSLVDASVTSWRLRCVYLRTWTAGQIQLTLNTS